MMTIEFHDDVVALVRKEFGSVEAFAKEAIVLDLHRRGTISQGKAAELLGMERYPYQLPSRDGIPAIDMPPEE